MSPDTLEFALAAILAVTVALIRSRFLTFLDGFAKRTAWCMLALAILPITLRLLLLPRNPVPIPSTADDTSYLLLADTLAHFRLANPAHPFHRFFETNFVLQEPTYSSIFPLGQGFALAIGKLIFSHPWAGVLISEGLLSALCYWMLLGWLSPGWALTGGVLSICEFGPLSYWMNSYWGGAVSGIAGCLVFGAIPRRNWTLLGLGLGIQILTRPFEFVLLVIAAGLFFTSVTDWKGWEKVTIGFVPAILVLALHNHAVTGSWTTLPYEVSRAQYGSPTTFTFQPNPAPTRQLSQEEQDNYDAQSLVHDREARKPFLKRLSDRLRYYRFFFLPPLYLAIPGFFLALNRPRMRLVLATIVLFAAGTNFYPYFYSHYVAAIACMFLLVIIVGLQEVARLSEMAAAIILGVAAAHFLFWYGLHLTAREQTLATALPYETSDYINSGDQEGRVAVRKQLDAAPGKQLVFVRFAPLHPLREWIQNEANIDNARIVWALDLGRQENSKLRQYYQYRNAWLLEPDDHPPRLVPYPDRPVLRLENVP